jgi:peptidoglycan/xylan/chitin deacetylase (PgdA/CDA1 family)
VAQTAALLDARDRPIAFRPPYGAWDETVAATLNGDAALAATHVGPVGWDIDRTDWAAWRDGADPAAVAVCYRVQANTAGRGIVLLHDSSADGPAFVAGNRTAELTRALVPMLKADGFRFVSLDAII